MTREEQLEQEIKDKQHELENLRKEKENDIRKKFVKELSEYSVEEKVKIFDSIYSLALNSLEFVEGDEYHEDSDEEHYAWEAQMNILARDKKGFWDYYNSFID